MDVEASPALRRRDLASHITRKFENKNEFEFFE